MIHLPNKKSSTSRQHNEHHSPPTATPADRSLFRSSENFSNNSSQGEGSNSVQSNSTNVGCTSLMTSTSQSTVLLSTIKAEIRDTQGHFQLLRILLDSGSQANFISKSCLNRLGLVLKKSSVPVLGLNESSSSTNGVVSSIIRPIGKISENYISNVRLTDKTFLFWLALNSTQKSSYPDVCLFCKINPLRTKPCLGGCYYRSIDR